MNELQELNYKVIEEKKNVYSKGITLLPGFTVIVGGALYSNTPCVIAGSLVAFGGLFSQTDKAQEIREAIKRR